MIFFANHPFTKRVENDNPGVVEALALPYADHLDYRQEWRP